MPTSSRDGVSGSLAETVLEKQRRPISCPVSPEAVNVTRISRCYRLTKTFLGSVREKD